MIWSLLLACNGPATPTDFTPTDSPSDSPVVAEPESISVSIQVLLDGAPLPDATVQQGGSQSPVTTDASGQATLQIDLSAAGEHAIVAAHPQARTGSVGVDAQDQGQLLELELTPISPQDNPDYRFRDPGEPDITDTTEQCSHCHKTINRDWFSSPHRQAASNPWVQQLYAGTSAWTQAECEQGQGTWAEGEAPGTGEPEPACFTDHGTLPQLNLCDPGTCEDTATAFGACADCHAPGIDGVTGGRDLHDATGFAYEFGVHCDVCHKVESTDPSAAEPGVAGKLSLLRPTETGAFGQDWYPQVFGPFADVPSPVMGAVQRDHFQDGSLCAGCHEHWQDALVPEQSVDASRWPQGLPVHTTWSEWRDGPLGDAVSCQSCHMPPDPSVGNAADLGNLVDLDPGVVPGWYRPEGQVRRHQWVGPRSPDSQMLQLAAALDLERDGDTLSATVSNVGPAHFIPTGEPMRQLILSVQATCDGSPVELQGPALPTWSGALETRESTQDWGLWPDAQPGQRLRVVQIAGALNYQGWGPFDGSDAQYGGLQDLRVVGEVEVISVSGTGALTTSAPIPSGDRIHLLPAVEDTLALTALAGTPGVSFQRLLVDADGTPMVPHHAAVDLLADNRIAPSASVTQSWTLPECAGTLQVDAQLLHRDTAWDLAAEKGWSVTDTLMAGSSL
ncbi:MAG: hypothetical protein VX899_16120 [Myxococcota bacterium]|nr:hypothetical protein [Myxococcota bacterium]